MILISAMLHMAVFIIWWQKQQQLIVTTTIHGSPLNISIAQPSRPAQPEHQALENKSENRQPVPATHRKDTALNSRAINKPSTTTVSPAETQNRDTRKKVDDQVAELALLNNNMIDYLSSEFKVRFKYPHLARKRGWQGEVLINLDINRHGKISQVVIARSSGYKILDLNAVKTFELIGELSPSFKKELLENHHLSIPVIYQLTGS
jgi:protein TonB